MPVSQAVLFFWDKLILHGQGVLIVTVADIAALVLGIRTPVHEALGIVDVAVSGGATKSGGLGGILQVDENETRPTRAGAGLRADSDSILLLLVDHNVVRRARGQAVPVARQIARVGESDGARRVDGQQLAEVEDLHTMARRLAADDDEVLVAAQLAPDRVGRVRRQAAEVDELTRRRDLGEAGAVGLGDYDKLAAVGRRPAPRRGALAGLAAEGGMALEVVEVDLGACQTGLLAAI